MGRVRVKENGEWGEWQTIEQYNQAREEKWQDPKYRAEIESHLPMIAAVDPEWATLCRAKLDGDDKTAKRIELQTIILHAKSRMKRMPHLVEFHKSYIEYLLKQLKDLDHISS